MARSPHLRRTFVIGALLAGLFGGIACEELDDDPQLAFMLIYLPGNDTVIVDIESGVVESGPITMFGNVDFSAEFFAANGQPDSRVTEARFRLDVTPTNMGVITFSRVTPFSGTLNKVSVGETQVSFALFNLETQMREFDLPVDASVN
jgi:hypothetical protein